MSQLLDDIVLEIADAPHSAAALTLYALVSTLEFEQAGYLFKLVKLRDLSAEQRQLAYRLMDLMADGGNQGEQWDQAKARMDELVRAG
ncbi:hypothetical protein [Thiosocius teredinicola]|uniref:hypothetical protein n=1 Tax=Thiosocius teredinicola TaxID=1973002 RepID=UPI0009910E52